jgi:Lon protease-like protein
VSGLQDIFPVAGVGLIRACVENPDGTSNLILQGLKRVRIRKLHEDFPYRTGEVEELLCDAGEQPQQARSLDALQELCQRIQEAGHPLPPLLEKHLRSDEADAGDLADLACSAFVKDPLLLQQLLEEPVVEKRIGKLLKFLQ